MDSSAAAALLHEGDRAEAVGDLLGATAAFQRARQDSDPHVAARAAFRLGRVAWRQGRYDAAIPEFDHARILALRLGDSELCARSENGIGAVHYARGEYAKARVYYNLALARTTEPAVRARIHLNLGVIANIQGDLESARVEYVESRRVFAEAGDLEGEALALHNLGMLHADLGQWTEANVAYQRSLELFERLGNIAMMANVLVNRSELLTARGDLAPAIDSCDQALSVFEKLGDVVGRGEALRWKGHAYCRAGATELAERFLEESVRIAHRSQAPLLEAEASREMAALRAEVGDLPDARRWYLRAIGLFAELGAKRDEHDSRAELARLEARQ